jgi:hypothetical protein
MILVLVGVYVAGHCHFGYRMLANAARPRQSRC